MHLRDSPGFSRAAGDQGWRWNLGGPAGHIAGAILDRNAGLHWTVVPSHGALECGLGRNLGNSPIG